METSAIPDRGPRQFDDGFTVRLVQFGTTTTGRALGPSDHDQIAAIAAIAATPTDPARRFVGSLRGIRAPVIRRTMYACQA